MAIARIFEATVVGTGTGGATQTVTVPFSAVSGSNCCAVLLCTARSTLDTFNISATFDGSPMTLAAEASAALGGFGEGSASIFYLPVGNLSNASGDAVFTMTSSDGDIGRIATLVILSDVDQAAPLNNTDTTTFTSGGISSSVTVLSASTDFVLDAITFGGQPSTVTVGAGQTLIDNSDNGVGNGDSTEHACSEEGGGASTTTMSWSFSSSSYAHVGASFQENLGPDSPEITEVTPSEGAGAIVRPSDKAIGVDGVNLSPGGTTELWMAETNSFAAATKVQQSISSITGTSLVWDEVNFGSFPLGVKYLFVVTDAGGPGELVSSAFPIIATNKDVRFGKATHITNGTASLQTVASGLDFKPVAAFINVTGNTSLETIESGCEIGHCLVTLNGSAGVGAASQATGPVVRKRKQAFGTGSLMIMDGTSDAAADHVTGTPALTDDGMEIDFSINTAGYYIEIIFIGGRSVQAEVVDVTISDGSYSGLGFSPEFLIGISSNQTAGSVSDTTFARQVIGFAKGSGATDQHYMATDHDSADRNTSIVEGAFLAQLSATANTWEMAITSFDADGFSWSGTNADNAYVMAMHLDGAQIFMDQWANVQTTPASEEDLPDSGIDQPGVLVMMNGGRTTPGPATALGVRWATGICFRDEVQSGATNVFAPATGTGTTEQHHSHDHIISNSSTAGTLTIQSTIVRFSRTPRLRHDAVPAAGLLHNLLMIEEIFGDDEGGAWATAS